MYSNHFTGAKIISRNALVDTRSNYCVLFMKMEAHSGSKMLEFAHGEGALSDLTAIFFSKVVIFLGKKLLQSLFSGLFLQKRSLFSTENPLKILLLNI